MPWAVAAAGVAAAGSIGGSAISAGAAGSASKAQQAESMAALASQNAQWAYSQQQLQPYMEAGVNATTRNNDLIDDYNTQVMPQLNNLLNFGQGATAQATLEQTPGYQFTLNQGLKATQNAAAARGLGVSGAALKGAASYATGLADSTYQQQYNNALTNYSSAANSWQNQFNANASMATVGENAAVGAGAQSQAASYNNSNLLTGIGNTQAASTLAGANATTSGVNSATNAISNALLNPAFQSYLSGSGSQYNVNNSPSSTPWANAST